MQPEALLRNLHGKRRRVRPVAVAALNGVVRDEPRVAAAALAAAGRRPARHVGLILIPHADGAPVERRPAAGREMKNELVAVIHEPVAVDRLVVADGHVVIEADARSDRGLIDRDRLHPVNGVLQQKVAARHLGDFERDPWVRGFGADVEEERRLRGHGPGDRPQPLLGPVQVVPARDVIPVRTVPHPDVVRRGSDDGPDRSGSKCRQDVQTVAVVQADVGVANVKFVPRPNRPATRQCQSHTGGVSVNCTAEYRAGYDGCDGYGRYDGCGGSGRYDGFGG